jgi:hypothetical protein
MHRRGYRKSFHFAVAGAFLVAIATYAVSDSFGRFLAYHVAAMGIVGGVVGLAMWRVAYTKHN